MAWENDVTTALSNWDIAGDAELARAAAAGDRLAFGKIYDRYADRLHDFCVGMLRDRDAAADCVQDVFCTAATQLPKLRDPDRLRPWLYAIARNEALRCIRDRRREQVSDDLPEAASHDAGPDTLAARSELAELIAEAAGGLSDRDRTVLELAYRHGLDGPELATALDVSAGTANRMVSRLRTTIETSLGALLVARRARHTAETCPELGAILADWDGRFSVLMRKRIARHIESCPTCQEERRRLVSPAALLGAVPVFIPAPDWLKDSTLSEVKLTSADSDMVSNADDFGSAGTTAGAASSPQDSDDPSGPDPLVPGDAQSSRRALIPWIALFAAALIVALGLGMVLFYHHNTAVSPTQFSGTVHAPFKPLLPPAAPAMVPSGPAPQPAAPPVISPAPGIIAPPAVAPAPVEAPNPPPPPPVAGPPAAPPPPAVVPPPVLPPPPGVLPPPVFIPPPVVVRPPAIVQPPAVPQPPSHPAPAPAAPKAPTVVPSHPALAPPPRTSTAPRGSLK